MLGLKLEGQRQTSEQIHSKLVSRQVIPTVRKQNNFVQVNALQQIYDASQIPQNVLLSKKSSTTSVYSPHISYQSLNKSKTTTHVSKQVSIYANASPAASIKQLFSSSIQAALTLTLTPSSQGKEKPTIRLASKSSVEDIFKGNGQLHEESTPRAIPVTLFVCDNNSNGQDSRAQVDNIATSTRTTSNLLSSVMSDSHLMKASSERHKPEEWQENSVDKSKNFSITSKHNITSYKSSHSQVNPYALVKPLKKHRISTQHFMSTQTTNGASQQLLPASNHHHNKRGSHLLQNSQNSSMEAITNLKIKSQGQQQTIKNHQVITQLPLSSPPENHAKLSVAPFFFPPNIKKKASKLLNYQTTYQPFKQTTQEVSAVASDRQESELTRLGAQLRELRAVLHDETKVKKEALNLLGQLFYANVQGLQAPDDLLHNVQQILTAERASSQADTLHETILEKYSQTEQIPGIISTTQKITVLSPNSFRILHKRSSLPNALQPIRDGLAPKNDLRRRPSFTNHHSSRLSILDTEDTKKFAQTSLSTPNNMKEEEQETQVSNRNQAELFEQLKLIKSRVLRFIQLKTASPIPLTLEYLKKQTKENL